MNKSYFLKNAGIKELIPSLARDFKLFAPERIEETYKWRRVLEDSPKPPDWSQYRTVEPLKTFFFPPRYTVATYSADTPQGKADLDALKEKQTVLFGTKACDLRSLKVLDHVFLEGEIEDPFYKARRENTILIASDCTEFTENCFCLALGINPFPEDNYDIKFSVLEEGLLLEAGSQRGESLLDRYRSHFTEATASQKEEAEKNRNTFIDNYRKKIAGENLPEKDSIKGYVEKNFKSGIWENYSEDCVECGACNLVCPTCHCFILQDYARSGGDFGRSLLWDSCQYKTFARVAGGANPRRRLAERIRNRFDKKFSFFPERIDSYACTGCGRCTEACLAGIDIREVLKELASA